MTTVADGLIELLVRSGVRQVWGVVGDALNPITDAIRRTDDIEWIGVRHEEVAAYAVNAQAQVTGTIGVCMGTVGPGAIHLLNGLYDAKKSHVPVLAVVGQVPTDEIGSDYFQEVDNDRLFADVSVFTRTITHADEAPEVFAEAVGAALRHRGVAVITVPGDIGGREVDGEMPEVTTPPPVTSGAPADEEIAAAVAAIEASDTISLLVGCGARTARDEVLALADLLGAPMVLTLEAKEGLEHDNEFQVGQSGLLGNPAAADALHRCDTLVMIGTDFPYREFLPDDTTVIQIDIAADHIGRRVTVTHPLVGDARATVGAMLDRLSRRDSRDHLDRTRQEYLDWCDGQQRLTDPGHDRRLLGKLRSLFDDPSGRIRPELVAAAVDRHAPSDTVFTSDTGMSTVWLARFVTMGPDRRLVGSYNLGSMANALAQALGVQALDRERPVVSFSGDGGLMMLLGDLRTAVTYDLPVRIVVFDNGRLGMVKLEQEQGGLPEFGTVLDNPDLAAVASAMGLASRRVTEPDEVGAAVEWAFEQPGPVLLDMVTNPNEVALPPQLSVSDAWGFAIAKTREVVSSRT